MNTPNLSIIMTVYNGEAFLQETLDGIFAQTYTDFELVVVNNGSTDGTQAILDRVFDRRLRVIQAPSHGTFCNGIRQAYQNVRGRYIAVQDADDVPLLDRFAKQISAFEGAPNVAIVCSAYQEIDAEGSEITVRCPPTGQQQLIDAFQSNNPLAHSSYMFRWIAADQVQGYPHEYAYGPDFGLVIRMLKKGWDIKVLKDVLMKLRVHPGQTSILPKFSVVRAHDALHLFEEAAELEGVSDHARLIGSKHLSKCRLLYGLTLFDDGARGEGLKHVLVGLVRHPLYGLMYLGYRLSQRFGWIKSARVQS